MLLLCVLVVGVNGVWAEDYEKITSSSDLEVDAEYLLVSGTEAYSGVSSNIGQHVTVSFTDGIITDIKTAHVLKLGGNSDAWTFYDMTDEKYIAYTSTATSKSNNLYQVSSSSDNGATWTLTVSSTAVTMKNNYNTGRWMRYNSDRFCCYYKSDSESTTGSAVTLYKKKSTASGETTTTTIDASGITNTNKFVSTAAGSLSASVTDESDATIGGAAITWTSSNTSVATINSSGIVTLVAAGTTTITASYAGVTNTYKPSSDTYELTVTNEDPSLVTIWSEDFNTSYSTNSSTYSYSLTSSSVRASDNYAGGSAPELMLNASSGKFSATIPLSYGYIGNMTLQFKSNAKSITVASATTGVSVSGTATFATKDTHTVTLTGVTTSLNTVEINFSAGSDNVRLDDIILKAKPAPTKPTFSPVAGDILKGNTVTISAQDGTTIYYTTNGDTPTESSTEYTAPIAITAACTIKAIAVKDGVSSAVAEAAYTLLKPAVPTFSVAEKTFDTAFDMTIAGATGTTLKYTTDGTDPVANGTAVASNTKTITIPTGADITVKAVAILDEVVSNVASVTYTYDARPAPTFTLSDDEMTILVLSGDETITLTTNSDGAVTFTSSDDTKLEVDNSDNAKVGVLAAYEAGDYTITVRTAATSNYLAGEGTVTVHVIKKATTMAIETTFDDGKDLRSATEGLIEGTVKYNGSALSPQPTVTYSSSDETVATVAADGTITFKKAGSTTIIASYAGDDEYEACEKTYVLDLVDTTPQATSVSINLNNTFFGITAITSWRSGDPTSATGTSKNVSVTYAKGSGSYYYCNASQIRCYSGNSLLFTAPTGYYLSTIAFTSSDWNTATPTSGSMNKSNNKLWEGSSNTVSFSWSSTARIESATVTLAPAVTITTAKYATYCSPHTLDFSATGITVYKAKVNGSVVKMTEISNGIVPANTGVILYKDVDADTTIAVPVTTTNATITDNELVGTTVRTLVKKEAGSKYNYILQKSGSSIVFNMATTDGAYMPANRAYLSTAYNASAGSARLSVVFEDEQTTGIHTVNNEKSAMNGVVYDLQGRRVENPRKGGLYIVNGRKVVKN